MLNDYGGDGYIYDFDRDITKEVLSQQIDGLKEFID